MSTSNLSQDLATKLAVHIAELARATDAARMSEAMVGQQRSSSCKVESIHAAIVGQ
jgi:hypothetical protein